MGNLTSDIASGIETVIADLGTTCAFYKATNGVFNPATMARTKTLDSTLDVPVLFDESVERFAGRTTLDEISCRMLASSLGAVVPDLNDVLDVAIDQDQVLLRIVSVTRAAGNAVWLLRCKRFKVTA